MEGAVSGNGRMSRGAINATAGVGEITAAHAAALHGRNDEFTVLRGALESAFAGRGKLALVAGEAGIGKTSLVRGFAERASVRTLWGGCDELFTPRPLGPLLRPDLLLVRRPPD